MRQLSASARANKGVEAIVIPPTPMRRLPAAASVRRNADLAKPPQGGSPRRQVKYLRGAASVRRSRRRRMATTCSVQGVVPPRRRTAAAPGNTRRSRAIRRPPQLNEIKAGTRDRADQRQAYGRRIGLFIRSPGARSSATTRIAPGAPLPLIARSASSGSRKSCSRSAPRLATGALTRAPVAGTILERCSEPNFRPHGHGPASPGRARGRRPSGRLTIQPLPLAQHRDLVALGIRSANSGIRDRGMAPQLSEARQHWSAASQEVISQRR
jgi:hypothetical protein